MECSKGAERTASLRLSGGGLVYQKKGWLGRGEYRISKRR